MDEPVVEIVILNYNGEGIVDKCVQSILDKTTYRNYKIVFADNGSVDKSLTQAEKKYANNEKVLFIRIPYNTGYPKGMNWGVQERIVQGTSEFFIPLNDDIIITDPDWIQKLLKPMQDPKVGMTCCSLKTPSGRIQRGGMLQFNGLTMSYIKPFDHEKDGTIDVAAMAACLVRREVFLKIGGFDEKYTPFNSEENDFSLRTSYAGYDVHFIHDLFLFHDHGATLKKVESLFTYYITKRNCIRFRLLHYPLHWIFFSLFPEYRVWLSMFFFRDGKKVSFNKDCLKRVKLYVLAIVVNLLQLGEIIDRRAQLQTQKKVNLPPAR
ncbi:MAG TPA: glycosyltransferase [Candidatus Binatia bacterium]|nr:glycosyltransferase [Candidatus Binatia bacterium]